METFLHFYAGIAAFSLLFGSFAAWITEDDVNGTSSFYAWAALTFIVWPLFWLVVILSVIYKWVRFLLEQIH